MLREIKWLGIIAVALITLGMWLGHSIWPSTPEVRTIIQTDTLRIVKTDTIRTIITRKGQITTIKDTIRWEDTTAIASYQKLIEYLTNHETVIDDKPEVITPKADNFSLGVQGGVGYGLQSKDFSPIIACPIRFKRILLTPFAEYRDEFSVGAMAGMNF